MNRQMLLMSLRPFIHNNTQTVFLTFSPVPSTIISYSCILTVSPCSSLESQCFSWLQPAALLCIFVLAYAYVYRARDTGMMMISDTKCFVFPFAVILLRLAHLCNSVCELVRDRERETGCKKKGFPVTADWGLYWTWCHKWWKTYSDLLLKWTS